MGSFLTWGICKSPRLAGKVTRDFLQRDRDILDSDSIPNKELDVWEASETETTF